jgi:hypothetical protein
MANSPQDARFISYLSMEKLRANRENAKKSTGPKTARGKRIASRNAVKHGILAVAVPDEREDGDAFDLLVDQLCDDYEPVGVREHIQVQRVAAALWRLRRALLYERDHFYRTDNPDLERTLRYEAHAERALEQATRELHRLQSERKARELEDQRATRSDTPSQEEQIGED